jgi:hypothetical protein
MRLSLSDHRSKWAALHLVSSRQAEVVTGVWYQIAKASSSNATASRRFTGSSTATS